MYGLPWGLNELFVDNTSSAVRSPSWIFTLIYTGNPFIESNTTESPVFENKSTDKQRNKQIK